MVRPHSQGSFLLVPMCPHGGSDSYLKVTLGAKLIIPEETMIGVHTLNFISC